MSETSVFQFVFTPLLFIHFFFPVWNVQTKKLHEELPGHADEVFAVDWAPDGSRVASGGKDRVLKL